MMRRLVSGLVVVALCSGASAEALMVRVGSKLVLPSTPFTLTVDVSGADSLAGLRLQVDYHGDRTHVDAAPVAMGAANDRRVRANPLTSYPDSSGVLEVAWLSAIGLSGSDTVLVLPLRGRAGEGVRDTLAVTVLDAVDLSGNVISAAVEAGVVTYVSVTDIDPSPNLRQLALSVFPSPARAGVLISLALPDRRRARVEVFDAVGRRLWVPLDRVAGPGTLTIPWGHQRRPATGVYFVRATVDDRTLQQRFVIVR